MDSVESSDSTNEIKFKTETDNFNWETTPFDLGPIKDEELIAEEKHIIDVIGNEEIDYGKNNTSDVVSIVKKKTDNNSQSNDNLQASTVSACKLLNGVGLLTKPKANTFKCDLDLRGFKTKIQFLIDTHMKHKNATPTEKQIVVIGNESIDKDKKSPNDTVSVVEETICNQLNYKNSCTSNLEKHNVCVNSPKSCKTKITETKPYCCEETDNSSKKLETETYFCEICGLLYTKKRSFNDHYRKHSMKPFTCKICDYITNPEEKQGRCNKCDKRFRCLNCCTVHKSQCTRGRKYFCEICGLLFTTKTGFNAHYKTHTVEKPFTCKVCNYITNLEEKRFSRHCGKCNKCFRCENCYTVHKRQCTRKRVKRQYLCEICGAKCSSPFFLNAHYRKHTGERPFPCELCNFKAKAKSYLLRHMQTHTKEKNYKCEICSLSFSFVENLNRHHLIHTGTKRFSCSVCKARFHQKGSLTQHLLLHTGEKPFKCNVCDYCCTTKGRLKIHMARHTGVKLKRYGEKHKRHGEKPFTCNVCNKTFMSKQTLAAHMPTHTGEKPFKCNVCDYSFTSRTRLTYHKVQHSGVKSFKCHFCDFSTAYYSRLYHHRKKHLDPVTVKKFECDKCDYRSTFKENLNRHRRVHTGEKPYQCRICWAKFSQNSVLKGHMNKHTGEKPFHCNLCDYKCTKKQYLAKHQLKHC